MLPPAAKTGGSWLSLCLTLAAVCVAPGQCSAGEGTELVSVDSRGELMTPGIVVSSGTTSYRLTELIKAVGETGLRSLDYESQPGEDANQRASTSNARALQVLRQHYYDASNQACVLEPLQSHYDVVADRTRRHLISPRVNSVNGSYSVEDLIGRGAHGEVWRAVRIHPNGTDDVTATYVIKRLYHNKPAALLSGYREVHFGLHPALTGHPHLTRFIEHWKMNAVAADEEGGELEELWLVFRDEGTSMQRLAFQPVQMAGVGGDQTVRTLAGSHFWARMLTEDVGGGVYRAIARALLTALADLHSAGIVHRDVKSANILLGAADGTMAVRLGDFGSAVDDFCRAHLYTAEGPSQDEETVDYAPPEVRLGEGPYDASYPFSYDVFSLGVVLLELLLGKPPSQIFDLDARAAARLRQHMWDQPEAAVQRKIIAATLESFGITAVSEDITEELLLARFRSALRRLESQARQQASAMRRSSSSDGASAASSSSSQLQEADGTLPLALFEGGGAFGDSTKLAVALASNSLDYLALESGVTGDFARLLMPPGTLAAPSVSIASHGDWALVRSNSNELRQELWYQTPEPPNDDLNDAVAGMHRRDDGGDGSTGNNNVDVSAASSAPVMLLGEEGEELLFHMLCADPGRRITAQAALQHPFFRD